MNRLTEAQIRTLFQIVDDKLHRRLLNDADAYFMRVTANWNENRVKVWNGTFYHGLDNVALQVTIAGFKNASKSWLRLVLENGIEKADEMFERHKKQSASSGGKKGQRNKATNKIVVLSAKKTQEREPIRNEDLFGKSRSSISANAVMSGWSVYG